MKTVSKLGLAAALAAAFAATGAFAQNDETSGQMMQGNGMMGGDMQGMPGQGRMMGMMQMMQQMGPMMEACTEMMQAMTDHMDSHDHSTDEG